MAVVYTNLGNGLIKAESDSGKFIIQDGTNISYYSAVDPEAAGRTYTESDVDIDSVVQMTAEEILEVLAGTRG